MLQKKYFYVTNAFQPHPSLIVWITTTQIVKPELYFKCFCAEASSKFNSERNIKHAFALKARVKNRRAQK